MATKTVQRKRAATPKAESKKSSKPAAAKKRAARPAAPVLSPEVRRALGFLSSIAFCGFLVLALLSYSSTDPGFSGSSTSGEVANWCGYWGAVLSDMLYQTIGFAAWSVLPFTGWIWLRFARRPGGSGIRGVTGALGTWWFAVFFGLLFFQDETAAFPAGGMLGEGTAGWLLSQVGTVGAYVVTALMLVITATVLFGIDWETVAESGVKSVERRTPVVLQRLQHIGAATGSAFRGAAVGVWQWATTRQERQDRSSVLAVAKRRP